MVLVGATTVGGLATGVCLLGAWFALGELEGARAAVASGTAVLAIAALIAPGLRQWLPERRRQVSDKLMLAPSAQAAFRWGFELGTGVSTLVVTPAMYALIGVALAQKRALAVLAVLAIYGAARGLAIASGALAHPRLERRGVDSLPGLGLRQGMRLPLIFAVLLASMMVIV
jgi:hypothetical protein